MSPARLVMVARAASVAATRTILPVGSISMRPMVRPAAVAPFTARDTSACRKEAGRLLTGRRPRTPRIAFRSTAPDARNAARRAGALRSSCSVPSSRSSCRTRPESFRPAAGFVSGKYPTVGLTGIGTKTSRQERPYRSWPAPTERWRGSRHALPRGSAHPAHGCNKVVQPVGGIVGASSFGHGHLEDDFPSRTSCRTAFTRALACSWFARM